MREAKCYTIAMSAQKCMKPNDCNWIDMAARMLFAHSDDEAMGTAHRMARETFPPSDGWYNHRVVAGHVDVDELSRRYDNYVCVCLAREDRQRKETDVSSRSVKE